MTSTPRYRRLFSVTSRMCSGRLSNAVPTGSADMSKPNLVAITT